MSASAVFILDLEGKVMIGRNYRGDVDMTCINEFMPLLRQVEDDCRIRDALVDSRHPKKEVP